MADPHPRAHSVPSFMRTGRLLPLVVPASGPVARARWLFLLGGLASAILAAVTLVATPAPLEQRWLAAAALGGLVWHWYAGYRRDRFTPLPLTMLLEGGALCAIAVGVGVPPRALGVFYAGINFRALYGSRRSSIALLIVYSAAFGGAVAITSRRPWVEQLPDLVLPQMLGFGLSVAVLHALARALERQERMAAVLAASEQRYRLLFESNPRPMWVYDVSTRRVSDVNLAAVEHYGYSREELLSMRIDDLHPAEDLPELHARLAALGATGRSTTLTRHRKKDGTIIDVEVTGCPLDHTLPGHRIVVANDVTDRVRAERAVRASEARFRSVAESLDEAIVITDRAGVILYASGRTNDVLGRAPGDLVGRGIGELLFPGLGLPEPSLLRDAGRRHHEIELVHAGGRRQWIAVSVGPFQDADGAEVGLLVTLADITDRHEAGAELRAMNHTLQTLIDLAPQAIITVDLDWRITRWNRAAERIFGWSEAEVMGGPLPFIPSGDEAEFQRHRCLMREQHGLTGIETRYVRKDGALIDVLLSTAELRDRSGVPAGFIAVLSDITESKRMEAQLRQSQKLEAIGQLAGGIAHDFNNLVTSIKCNAAYLLDGLEVGDPRREGVGEIDDAATRAMMLTRQLLAFSRKQVLQPMVLDLNAVVTDLGKMLRRIMPENITQTLSLDPATGHVLADPGQLEQVILNLAVNARDAMPAGGVLTIATTWVDLSDPAAWHHEGVELRPGEYVVLSVSDTGTGIDRATQERIFEPFFTTKPVGYGTGLGLSTVYGIVKQSGGYVWVYSEVGRGSVFRVYLPRVVGPADRSRHEPERRAMLRTAGSERILVIEDEGAIRAVVSRLLRSQGYTVLTAANAVEAFTLLEQHPGAVDLVLTDIIMPGMSGPAFAEELARRAGGKGRVPRVLFMSGYTRSHIVQSGILEPGMELLEKPFTPVQLTERVRAILDRPAPVERISVVS
jgi:two-component system cell cycle sensor histidine kinase/response regulator CckA